MLRVGDKAPDFVLPSSAGGMAKLADFVGKKLVLYFYPRDLTPGCTQEACAFRDTMGEFAKYGATVVGVSKDSLQTHAKFQSTHALGFPLLTDDGNNVAIAYGAYGEKVMYGKRVQGTIRSTFLIDEQGALAAIWSPVKVAGHVDAVLAALAGAGRPTLTPKKVATRTKKYK